MSRLIIAAAITSALALCSPVHAQSMAGMDMKGMSMSDMQKASAPAKKPAAKPKRASRHAPQRTEPRHRARRSKPGTMASSQPTPPMDRSGHDHAMAMPPSSSGGMEGMDMGAGHESHDMASVPGMQMGSGSGASQMQTAAQPSGTDLAPGNAPPPALPMDHFADRTYDAAAMERARSEMMRDDGGRTYSKVMLNLAELQAHRGRDGYRWDGEAWIGGDRNRLFVKSEGEGTFHEGVGDAEVQALYSRAVGPYFSLQAGIRQDFRSGPNRTYATLGFEGLAPYMFETEGAVFVSQKGDILGRLEGWYDEHLTQRLVLQPRVELNLSAQNVPENRYGPGLVDAELGLRLRYEIRREFAPYVGVSWERKTGRTADYAREDGERVGGASFVAGIRFWF